MSLAASPSLVGLEGLVEPVVLRITTPWYRPLSVDAGAFGAYHIQFAATLEREATRLYIAAFPEPAKNLFDSAERPVCALSGSFGNQQQVIAAWDSGFAVIGLNGDRAAPLGRAIVDALLKSGWAEILKL